MYRSPLGAAAAFVLGFGTAAASADFSGRWTFDAAESTNADSMSQATIVSTIAEGPTRLTVVDHSVHDAKSQDSRTVYDLTGQPVTNRSETGGRSTTITYWAGRKLVTEWESEGTVSGSRVRSREARYLSPDGQTMYLESSGTGGRARVFVFHRMP